MVRCSLGNPQSVGAGTCMLWLRSSRKFASALTCGFEPSGWVCAAQVHIAAAQRAAHRWFQCFAERFGAVWLTSPAFIVSANV